MERTIRRIGITYYSIYTSTILATVVGYTIRLNSDNHINSLDSTGIALKSIIILYLLASIPLALGGFHYMTKKWQAIEDERQKFKAYEKGATWRLLLVGIGLVASIIVFFLLGNDISLLYCFGIEGIALFFCKPSVGKMISDLKLEE